MNKTKKATSILILLASFILTSCNIYPFTTDDMGHDFTSSSEINNSSSEVDNDSSTSQDIFTSEDISSSVDEGGDEHPPLDESTVYTLTFNLNQFDLVDNDFANVIPSYKDIENIKNSQGDLFKITLTGVHRFKDGHFKIVDPYNFKVLYITLDTGIHLINPYPDKYSMLNWWDIDLNKEQIKDCVFASNIGVGGIQSVVKDPLTYGRVQTYAIADMISHNLSSPTNMLSYDLIEDMHNPDTIKLTSYLQIRTDYISNVNLFSLYNFKLDYEIKFDNYRDILDDEFSHPESISYRLNPYYMKSMSNDSSYLIENETDNSKYIEKMFDQSYIKFKGVDFINKKDKKGLFIYDFNKFEIYFINQYFDQTSVVIDPKYYNDENISSMSFENDTTKLDNEIVNHGAIAIDILGYKSSVEKVNAVVSDIFANKTKDIKVTDGQLFSQNTYYQFFGFKVRLAFKVHINFKDGTRNDYSYLFEKKYDFPAFNAAKVN